MIATSLEMTMSEPVRHPLELFDALPEPEKRSSLLELLRRGTSDTGGVSATTFDALADDLFAALDAEEAAHAADR